MGMKHCPWCGAEASAGKPVDPGPGKCPRCVVEMVLVKVGPRSLNECTQCGGLWVSRDTLQEICTSQEEQEAILGYDFQPLPSPGALPGKTDRLYVPCPECSKLMNRRNFAGCSGIVIDWCKAHGTWFDRRELQRIVQFIQGGGLRKSREREKTKLEEQKLHLQDEQRNLAAIARLAGDGSSSRQWSSNPDPFLNLIAGLWRNLDS